MHHESRALAPPRVTAGRIAGQQRGEQALVERLPGCREERALHLGHDLGPREDIALDRVRLTFVALGDAAGPVHALSARVRRGAIRPDRADLPGLATLVTGDRGVERRLHRRTVG
jgi:hypothetical protein